MWRADVPLAQPLSTLTTGAVAEPHRVEPRLAPDAGLLREQPAERRVGRRRPCRRDSVGSRSASRERLVDGVGGHFGPGPNWGNRPWLVMPMPAMRTSVTGAPSLSGGRRLAPVRWRARCRAVGRGRRTAARRGWRRGGGPGRRQPRTGTGAARRPPRRRRCGRRTRPGVPATRWRSRRSAGRPYSDDIHARPRRRAVVGPAVDVSRTAGPRGSRRQGGGRRGRPRRRAAA